MPFFALLYDYVPDYLERRGALRKAHFEHASASMARAEFQMGGAFADPVDGALLTFKASDRKVVEEFARNDPYVKGGLVTAWRIREWTVVMGAGVTPPEASLPSKDPLTEPGPWNSVATGYDEEFFQQLPAVIDKAIEVLGAPPESTVLDLATGPGTFAVPAARRFKKVVAIDFAEQMIRRLRGHLESSGIGNVETLVMDGHALMFEDASFDAVASMFGWFLFGDRARSLSEIHRVLRPGGRVLVASWATPDRNTVLGSGLEGLRAALPDLPRPPGPLPTQVPETCASEVRSAGFRDVATTHVTVDVTFESVDAYWKTMQRAGAPMVLLRKKLGDDAFEDAARKAREHLRGKLGTGQVTLAAAAIFTSGTR
jgi:SAM-dependent methyltransferase/uncharacterized protein YciI